MMHYNIYTDGSCSGNPGPGGWAAILQRCENDTIAETVEISGGTFMTTNNKMELSAAICALNTIIKPSSVSIYTDSQYVLKGITSWVQKWKANKWMRGNNPVKNVHLWQRLDELCDIHDVKWIWVKGHAGNFNNERADKLAKEAIPLHT